MTYYNNQSFSTFDDENGYKCPERHDGAWWYDYCIYANLNESVCIIDNAPRERNWLKQRNVFCWVHFGCYKQKF